MCEEKVEGLTLKILIIKLSAIGDVVQSLCVLDALKARFPEAKIDWLAGEAETTLLDGHPMLHRVITYPRRRLGKLCAKPSKWSVLSVETIEFIKNLRRDRYDIIIDLQGLLKSGMLTWFSRGSRKIGFASGREGSSMFLNEKLPPYDPDQHAVLRYMRIAHYLGAEKTREINFPLGLGQKQQKTAENLLKQANIMPGRMIGLVPGTRWPTKHWTVQGFSELALEITRETGMAVAVLGGRDDKELAAGIIRGSTAEVHDFTGKTDLRTLGALFRMTAAVVTTDTGPMHLAAAAGTPVVALFGPTSPRRTGPFTKSFRVITAGLDCSPCFRRSCSSPECMTHITPAQVMAGLKELLNP